MSVTVKMINDEDFPVVMESKEIWDKVIGKDRLCEVKFYQLINRPGCPRLTFGRKYLFPVKKFVEWLEQESLK